MDSRLESHYPFLACRNSGLSWPVTCTCAPLSHCVTSCTFCMIFLFPFLLLFQFISMHGIDHWLLTLSWLGHFSSAFVHWPTLICVWRGSSNYFVGALWSRLEITSTSIGHGFCFSVLGVFHDVFTTWTTNWGSGCSDRRREILRNVWASYALCIPAWQCGAVIPE